MGACVRGAAAAFAALVCAAACNCAIDPLCVEGEAGCALPACDDGLVNGAETDVDCGGTCAPCGEWMACQSADDCMVAQCTAGSCCAALCPLWGRSYGSLVEDRVIAALLREDGSALIVGAFSGAVDFGGGPLTSAGEHDLFVLGLSPAGDHLFSERFGADGEELDAAIIAGPGDHATLAVESFSQAIDFGGGVLASEGHENSFLLEIDARGRHVRSRRLSLTPGEVHVRGLGRMPDGGIAVAGSVYSGDLGGGALASDGGLDVLVARLDADWGHVWSQRFGSAWHDTGQRLAVDSAGNITVVASYSRSWSFGGAPLPWTGGFESVAVVQLGPAGEHRWSHGYGGGSPQFPFAVTADAAGEVTIAGVFTNRTDFGLGPIDAGVASSGFVVRYDAAGAPRWARALGEHTVSVEGLALDGSGGVLVAGSYRGDVDFGGGVALERGLDDVFVAQLDGAGQALAVRGLGGVARGAGVGVVARAGADGLRALLFGGHREALVLPAEALASAGGADGFVVALAP